MKRIDIDRLMNDPNYWPEIEAEVRAEGALLTKYFKDKEEPPMNACIIMGTLIAFTSAGLNANAIVAGEQTEGSAVSHFLHLMSSFNVVFMSVLEATLDKAKEDQTFRAEDKPEPGDTVH